MSRTRCGVWTLHRWAGSHKGCAMELPDWIGIPGAILLIAFMVYGFLQGMKVTKKQEGDPPDRSHDFYDSWRQ